MSDDKSIDIDNTSKISEEEYLKEYNLFEKTNKTIENELSKVVNWLIWKK